MPELSHALRLARIRRSDPSFAFGCNRSITGNLIVSEAVLDDGATLAIRSRPLSDRWAAHLTSPFPTRRSADKHNPHYLAVLDNRLVDVQTSESGTNASGVEPRRLYMKDMRSAHVCLVTADGTG